MYYETVDNFAALSIAKKTHFEKSFFSYLTESVLAGVYVGFGIILIFSVGSPLAAANAPIVNLVMGLSFGIALTLVVFAGSELFTGNNLCMMIGTLEKKVGWKDLLNVWIWSWAGNFLGSIGLAILVLFSGVMNSKADFVTQVARLKMQLPWHELFFRAVLCNWLVCLAIWTSSRTRNDAAKCILIFWCLFAFIACGFEHSVANMTLLPLALLLPHPATVTWLGLCKNISVVSLGNIIGGAFCVGWLYWNTSRLKHNPIG
ncbi:MAG: formate/nitrite transporter family protein [Planctomycetota bacterium]